MSQAQLERISEINIEEAQAAVIKKIFEESQILVPVDTGELKNSGEYDETSVSYGTDHAAPVEFGTYKMRPQSYLRAAVRNNIDELSRISAAIIQQEVREAV